MSAVTFENFFLSTQLKDFSEDSVNNQKVMLSIAEEDHQRSLDQHYNQGYQDGFQQGRDIAKKSIDAFIARSLSHIHQHLKNIEQHREHLEECFHKNLAVSLWQMMDKIYPAFAQTLLLEEYEKFIKDAFLEEKTPLAPANLYVSSQVIEALQKKIGMDPSLVNRLHIQEGAILSETECHLEWKHGGLEKSLDHVVHALKETVKSYAFQHGLDISLLEGDDGTSPLKPSTLKSQEV